MGKVKVEIKNADTVETVAERIVGTKQEAMDWAEEWKKGKKEAYTTHWEEISGQ